MTVAARALGRLLVLGLRVAAGGVQRLGFDGRRSVVQCFRLAAVELQLQAAVHARTIQ